MAFEHKDNSFSVFKNKRKANATHADLAGDGMFNGQAVWVNLWSKSDKNGDPYYSGSIRPKDAKPSKPAPKPDEDDSEIPF